MRHLNAAKARASFKVLADGQSCQCAAMVLKPGESSSEEPENEHPRSEQWLYVISGTGKAKVGRSRAKLAAGSLLLIEKGEPHQITATGTAPLMTINFYAPRAYRRDGKLRR